ncbi:EAL domain-containing protein [Halomonas aquamarina]|uniref:EAL domain-containing protein n=1 Tax=Vreelandella aquamarina TaxID=77097 RepID=A0ACC5VV24_9GAMM|nr:EAL domain-containing protein [Halomonas aquamarina]
MHQDLPISRVMQTGILQCTKDTPLSEAARRMTDRCCSSIVIMENHKAVGIWTEHDALSINFSTLSALNKPIATFMSQPVHTASGQMLLSEAALLLNTHKVRHLVVIDEASRPVGIISQTDIVMNQGLEPYLRLREVHAAMRRDPLLIEGSLSVADAAARMRTHQQDAAIIVDDHQLGIVTERDLVSFIANRSDDTPVIQLSSKPLLSVTESTPLINARDLLINHRIRHLVVRDSQEKIVGLLGFGDILSGAEYLYLADLREALTQRDQALARSRQHLQLAERVIDSSLEGIIITDADACIEFVNPAFTHLTGYTLEEVAGKKPSILGSGRQDADFYEQMWASLKVSGYWRGEVWNRRKSGELYLELLTITAIKDDSGVTQHYAGLFSDITHVRENEEQIRHLAYYDVLTRLPNRRLLEDRITLAIRHAHREAQQIAVIFIDLDHFKQVNDTLGHALGDELLLEVAARMTLRLREDDTLARLGGDEFIALLPDISGFTEASSAAQRLIDAVSAPYTLKGHSFRIGCSIGISLYPDDGDTPEVLIQHADAAMYRAKREGRNTYRLYQADVDRKLRDQLSMETALRNAVDTGDGLYMAYQPLVSRKTRQLVSAEALVRWTHPVRGNIGPDDFIPLAESSGLILPLGDRVMDLVLDDMHQWRASGKSLVPVAINLSSAQFWQPDFVQTIAQKLQHHAIAPSLITFELTESILLNRQAEGAAVLHELRALGCKIALDDFGTGYSSLSYLHNIPAHALKIDRSFIEVLHDETHNSQAIVAAIASLARELDLKVVAEGVETEQQWQQLGEYGIDIIQGYYIARPQPAGQFVELLGTLTHER